MPIEIIDTHVHTWDLNKAEYSWLKGDTSIINRTFLLDELDEQRLSAGITGGVLVQADNQFEDTDYMLQVASKNNWIKGVVGWLPLLQPDKLEQVLLGTYSQNTYFKGVRHLIHNEQDPNWLLKNEVIESLAILAKNNFPYDLVGIVPQHIETALKVAERVPELKVVFDHLNQPPIKSKEKFGKWGELMKNAASHPNFYAKISGLGTTVNNPNGWTAEDVRPYIEFAIEQFGENRCFCGGDWPVSLLAGSYSKSWTIYHLVLSELLDEKGLEKVMSGNAIEFYHL
jgi:L-fuconolactonase